MNSYKISEHQGEFFISVTAKGLDFSDSLDRVLNEYSSAQLHADLDLSTEIWVRLFLSDFSNQNPSVEFFEPRNSLPILIGQSPLDSTFVSLMAYHIKSPSMKKLFSCGYPCLTFNHGGYITTIEHRLPDYIYIRNQNEVVLQNLLTIEDEKTSLLRTWFYLRDIENTYDSFVRVRRTFFNMIGFTKDTHYIASTGIGATPSSNSAHTIAMTALSTRGIKEEQIHYLRALDHLSPTVNYGVTFERATKVSFGDRDRIYISGTASIDKKGNIVHIGNVVDQTKRALTNIVALLNEGGMAIQDMKYVLVYLRDFHSYPPVLEYLIQIFPNTPMLFVQASVCREGWLVEIEGEAIKSANHDKWEPFL